jgi:hypothetical protein
MLALNLVVMSMSSTKFNIPEKQGLTVAAHMELDTHADTCILGKNFVVESYSGRVCDVYAYSSTYDAIKNVAIITGVTAIQDPSTGEVYLLVVHEGLWYGDKMEHSLINPNQLQHFGVKVNDNP